MPSKPRILIFSTAYFPHIGGAEIAVAEITKRLSDHYDWTLLTVRLSHKDAAYEEIGAVKVFRLGFGIGRIDKFLFPALAWRKASALHRQESFSAIWAIMASFSGFAARIFKLRHKTIPYLLTLQEGDDVRIIREKVGWWPVAQWFRQIFLLADRIQAISNYLARWAADMGVERSVDVIPNGITLLSDLPDDEELSRILARLDLSPEDKIILSTSRLVRKNGLPDLIGAMTIIPDKRIKLVFCGEGGDRKDLEDLAERVGVSDRVRFAGFVPPADLSLYYSLARTSGGVFCRPSISEGLGNSFLEAMAHRVPVIGTAVGGIPDFLTDGVTGWFCRIHDPKSIAERIAYILAPENQAAVERVVSAAAKLVEERFLWDSVAETMRVIFDEMI